MISLHQLLFLMLSISLNLLLVARQLYNPYSNHVVCVERGRRAHVIRYTVKPAVIRIDTMMLFTQLVNLCQRIYTTTLFATLLILL